MPELFRRFFRPARRQSIFRTEQSGASGVSRVFGGLVVCLVVAALLSSARLVAMAERQEFGADRDRWLAAAEAVDAFSSRLALDRPATGIESLLGRSGNEPSEIVLGDLAGSATTTTTAPPTTTVVEPDGTTSLVDAPSMDTASTAVATAAPSITTPSTTGPSTTAPPPPILGDINVNNPLRIWSGGDSLGEYVGSELLYRVADTDFSVVELDFAISTGLARPDYFDWPARFSEVMQREDRPNVVIFMVGGTDDQDLRIDGERIVIGTPEWQSAYRERAATMMDIAAYPDVQMLWINLPPMRNDRRDNISLEINAALDAEAELRPWVRVVDIVDMFTGPSGGYEQFIDAPDGSATRKARASDGVHITRQASNWVAEVVWDMIRSQWRFDYLAPATTTPTTSPTTQPAATPPVGEGSTTTEPSDS